MSGALNLTIVKGGLSDHNGITDALNGVNAVISVLGNNTRKALFKPSNVISHNLPNIIILAPCNKAGLTVYCL